MFNDEGFKNSSNYTKIMTKMFEARCSSKRSWLNLGFVKLLIIIITCAVTYLTIITILSNSTTHPIVMRHVVFENQDWEKYLINTEGCRIKRHHPFDPSVSNYYDEETNPGPRCKEKSYLRAEGNKIYPEVDRLQERFKVQNINCNYQPILRNPANISMEADQKIGLGKSKRMKFGVPIKDEFIRIECFNKDSFLFEDYMALMSIKPEVEEKCEKASKDSLAHDALNIIIMAIDSTSKLNFLRHFPITNGYLQTTLKPFEFHGHTKVADNTFVNIVPMLTGHFVSYYRKSKKEVATTYYDDLDLVWKEFASLGYRTFFIEDTPAAGTFSYEKRGFQKPATDYYLRPFAMMVETTGTEWRTKRGSYCVGHMSETEFFYDYFKKFTTAMEERPFFSFTFISRITHTYLNTAGYGDKPTYNTLKYLQDSNILNKSALIFFSDHGLRFGDILKTYIGKVEERMPFMFQYYPEWFLLKHEDFRTSLLQNQRRLTTPFDVHKTLQQLAVLSSKDGKIDIRKEDTGYGQSLFTPISPKRTCNDAQISPHWCTCNDRIQYNKDDESVAKAASELINFINVLTSSASNLCKTLSLKTVIDAFVSHSSDVDKASDITDFLITVEAEPSGAIFEGTVRYNEFKTNEFKTIGEISRVNSYGNQSWCISDTILKKYCFC